MTALKVFPLTLAEVPLPISSTYVAEYLLFAHALELGCPSIIHGKDSNCFGQNSAIGLAMFKLQIGCLPQASLTTTVSPLLPDVIRRPVETLVFLSDIPHAPITAARLYANRSEEELRVAYRILFDHPAFTLELCPLP